MSVEIASVLLLAKLILAFQLVKDNFLHLLSGANPAIHALQQPLNRQNETFIPQLNSGMKCETKIKP
jgi:hypothetical protein